MLSWPTAELRPSPERIRNAGQTVAAVLASGGSCTFISWKIADLCCALCPVARADRFFVPTCKSLMPQSKVDSGRELLETVYDDLGFRSGCLLEPTADPFGEIDGPWQTLGEWLMLGTRVGADRIFFVGDDPVVVFTQIPAGADAREIVGAYRRAWSLGRARCLFLATADELRVYALTSPPPHRQSDAQALKPLDVVSRSADVFDMLASFHRDRMESGSLFEEKAFQRDGSADGTLLRDVQMATDALVGHGLPRSVAHGLIERVILIRYLEDREVVAPTYLQAVAAAHKTWTRAFRKRSLTPNFGAESAFVPCLSDRSLTFAIFAALAEDFNGDLFKVSDVESDLVTSEHLELVQRMLTGDGVSEQGAMFLWAYDFSVVPTALISGMYERFYRADSDDESSTHYTPQPLVEFVTSQILTSDRLAENPTVCDPACGSGIFLVEAYRRIVRWEMAKQARRLTTPELSDLLLTRVAGIDINSEAVRLAAFSLYLAFLSYQTPPDIRNAGPLPRLIGSVHSDAHSVLRVADAFDDSSPMLSAAPSTTEATQHGYGVIIGNPPWGEPPRSPATLADRWARDSQRTVGDRNLSQLFLWRALSMLSPDGVAALLVNATAFHNTRETSRRFRQEFLSSVQLSSVINFSSVRRTFFEGAVAPFMLVTFKPRQTELQPVAFRTVRPNVALSSSKSMSFASVDRRWVDQQVLAKRDYLWKVYAWGSHRDAALMSRLELEKTVADYLPAEPKPGWGYQRGSQKPTEHLKSLQSLRSFEPWGPLTEKSFEPSPAGVKRQPDERLYSGQRILVKRGVRVGFGPRSRLVTEDMSFRHPVYCLPLPNLLPWQAKTMWATLLSSFGRYSMFMRSGSWGLWHDSVLAGDILQTPLRMPEKPSAITKKIVQVVDSLPGYGSRTGLFGTLSDSGIPPVLAELDDAVFDLFEFSSDERTIITDFHRYLLGFAGGGADQFGSRRIAVPATAEGIADDVDQVRVEPLQSYISRFLKSWNARLAPDGALSWRIVDAPEKGLVAVIFETYSGTPTDSLRRDKSDWDEVMSRLPERLDLGASDNIGTDVTLRITTDTSMVIIKRDRERFWSASAAAEDAEVTFMQAIELSK